MGGVRGCQTPCDMATNNIAEQAAIIKSTLNDWASLPIRGGYAGMVPNLKQLFIQAAQDTQAIRILVCYGGQSRRGPFTTASATHRVDRKWLIAVTKGESPSAGRGDFLIEQTGNTDAFLKELATVEDICRWIPNISQEGPANDYEGTVPLQINDTQMSGYLITITTANDIPQPLGVNNQPAI
jgi:hypothetical protein